MKIPAFLEKISVKIAARGSKAAQIDPPRLGSPVRFPYGPFQFKAQVGKGIAYEIQASTNFKNWSSVSAGTSAGQVDFVDSEASKFSYRFYRLNLNGIYSANLVGYVTVTLPPAFAMIADPLRSANNRVAELFKEMPDGATLSKFDSRLHHLSMNKLEHGKWANPGETLGPGEGAIFFNPTSDYKSLSFVGEVEQGDFSTPVPGGFTIQSSSIPQAGRLDTELGFPIDEGDVIHLFDRDRQSYVLYPYQNHAWGSEPPIVSVGESFWVAKKSARNWIRNFYVE